MTQKEKLQNTANNILHAVGGKDNIVSVTHCMTRLRFNLKDESIPNQKEIEQISGVIGVTKAGGQYQIIVGQTVDKVYDALCDLANFKTYDSFDTTQDKPKQKLSFKSLGSSILDALAGCLTPLIPLLLATSIFKLFQALLGPSMLGILEETNDLFVLITFVGDAGFYFFPIAVAYTAARKFNVTPVLGIFLGGIMLHPTFVGMVESGAEFTVLGVPTIVQNYSSTVLPSIMSVWVMSYVEKFFNKHLPSTLKTIFAPFLTIVIMLPITLSILGPAGAFLGNYISNGLLSFNGLSSFLTIAIIGGLWQFLVLSGMHLVMISTLILA